MSGDDFKRRKQQSKLLLWILQRTCQSSDPQYSRVFRTTICTNQLRRFLWSRSVSICRLPGASAWFFLQQPTIKTASTSTESVWDWKAKNTTQKIATDGICSLTYTSSTCLLLGLQTFTNTGRDFAFSLPSISKSLPSGNSDRFEWRRRISTR